MKRLTVKPSMSIESQAVSMGTGRPISPLSSTVMDLFTKDAAIVEVFHEKLMDLEDKPPPQRSSLQTSQTSSTPPSATNPQATLSVPGTNSDWAIQSANGTCVPEQLGNGIVLSEQVAGKAAIAPITSDCTSMRDIMLTKGMPRASGTPRVSMRSSSSHQPSVHEAALAYVSTAERSQAGPWDRNMTGTGVLRYQYSNSATALVVNYTALASCTALYL
jgi:hypothetical protein